MNEKFQSIYWTPRPGWGWLLLHLLPVPACALSQLLPASSWCGIPGASPGPRVGTGFCLTTGMVTVTLTLWSRVALHQGRGTGLM